MRDLESHRHAYLISDSALRSRPLYQAHRAVRNAVAVADALGLPTLDAGPVLERIDEALDEGAAAGAPVFAPAELPLVLDTIRQVRDALRDGVDELGRPRGPIGRRILEDVERSGADAVFRRFDDGTVDVTHGWLAITDLVRVLDDLVPALEEAVARGLEVALVPGRGYEMADYGIEPEEPS